MKAKQRKSGEKLAGEVQGYVLKNNQLVWKSAVGSTMQGFPGEVLSKQVPSESFNYGADGVLEPPYDPAYLIKCLEISTAHMRCVKTKANDVAGGYQIVERQGSKEPDQVQKEDLEKFFRECGGDETFLDILDGLVTDMESIGWGALEIARDLTGRPARIWHIPAATIRKSRQGTIFLQRKSNRKRWFLSFPDKCKIKRNGSAIEAVEWKLVDPVTGRQISQANKAGVTPLTAANEVLFFTNYHPRSKHYGLPDFIPAVGAILGNVYARDFNLNYFSESLIPAYAVVVSGGTVNEETQKLIENYFADLKGKGRSTLVLTVPGKGVTIHFEKLENEIKDQSFSNYVTNNRNEVLMAHGVPPARIGVIETATLGSGSGLSQTENYKNAIVEPKQQRIEHKINQRLLREGFGITDWEFKFHDLDVRDRLQDANINCKYLEAGALTPNEVRADIGKEAKPWGDEPGQKPGGAGGMTSGATPGLGTPAGMGVPKAVMKADPAGRSKADLLRKQLKQALVKQWEGVELVGEGRDVAKIRSELRKSLLGVATLTMASSAAHLPSEIASHVGTELTAEEVDDVMSEVLGKFGQFMDTKWLSDFEQEMVKAHQLTGDARTGEVEKVRSHMAARSGLYAGLAWAMSNLLLLKSAAKVGEEVYWIPTSKAPCPSCEELANGSPYSPEELKQLPGDGSTLCRGNCACYLDIRPRGGGAPWVPERSQREGLPVGKKGE